MDRRIEPRFPVASSATVFRIDDAERELAGSLANISASGLSLVMEESLTVGSFIVVEVEHHLILGEVQNTQSRGSRFALGIRRLHALEKLDLSLDATRAENIRVLMSAFNRQGCDPGVTREPADSPQPTTSVTPALGLALRWPDAFPSILAPLAIVRPKPPGPSLAHFEAIRKIAN
jgi:hypothetical protein